jgi:hypothetical protein
MTDLSPAAQAVLDAANNSSAYGPEDCLNEARQIAAAALRTAADELDHPTSAHTLYAIADELEAQ